MRKQSCIRHDLTIDHGWVKIVVKAMKDLRRLLFRVSDLFGGVIGGLFLILLLTRQRG